MCDPIAISISSLAINIGSAIYGASEQNKQDDRNKKATKAALKANNRDISIRALQERVAAAQEAELVNQQAGEAAGLTGASAAGGNVGGMTVDLLVQDIENTRLQERDRIGQQLDSTLGSLDRERSGALATSRNQANQTSAPNPWAVGLRIGAGAIDAYGTYKGTQTGNTP